MIETPVAIPRRRDAIRRYLSGGELLFSHVPCEVTTVVGPCVALTFHHPPSGLSAIGHAMLPQPSGGESIDPEDPQRWKYVSFVIPAIARFIKDREISPAEVEAKLFGGAQLLTKHFQLGAPLAIGSSNVLQARRLLAGYGFSVCRSDVHGSVGRKIVFHTGTGAVDVKKLNPLPSGA